MLARTLALAALIISVSGCAAAVISGSTYAIKSAARDDLQPLAAAGDADAQYRLGKSWCCMGPGFDTQQATEWLCKAAAQGQAQALNELGRIYSGDVSRTPAPGQKILRLATVKRSLPHAAAFYQIAAAAGDSHASAAYAHLAPQLQDEERARSQQIAGDFSDSCTYQEVFGQSQTQQIETEFAKETP